MTRSKRAAPGSEEPGQVPTKRRSTRLTKDASAPSIAAPAPLTKAVTVATKSTKTDKKARIRAEPAPRRKAQKSTVQEPVPEPILEPASKDKASRAVSEDPDPESLPTTNPEAPRHEGEWYWLMKAEPESRFENGHDVRFSIDDLRAKEKPEGWDGIRAYPARNHMRNMNAGDKAFFYHSNCKEPSIVGIMEIVKEFSEDKSARRAGTPYYDPSSTKDAPRWSLVHVEFRKKLAVPITLKELRELGKAGGPLENMQMLKQSRLSVSRVSAEEWKVLCELADKNAKDAGREHETGKV
ncbi:hypothetical protein S40288_02299 [Stachybotrys chartarum IBT 40288]|nr:hypothetical protein S40288_02299 [Stachybotrys chartarum IBT 40288]